MITMTYNLAMAAGTDAGNRLMLKRGLTAWDAACYNEAAETFHRLYGHEVLTQAIGICPECHDQEPARSEAPAVSH